MPVNSGSPMPYILNLVPFFYGPRTTDRAEGWFEGLNPTRTSADIANMKQVA